MRKLSKPELLKEKTRLEQRLSDIDGALRLLESFDDVHTNSATSVTRPQHIDDSALGRIKDAVDSMIGEFTVNSIIDKVRASHGLLIHRATVNVGLQKLLQTRSDLTIKTPASGRRAAVYVRAVKQPNGRTSLAQLLLEDEDDNLPF